VYEILVVQFYVKGSPGFTASDDKDDNHNNEVNYVIIMTGEAIL